MGLNTICPYFIVAALVPVVKSDVTLVQEVDAEAAPKVPELTNALAPAAGLGDASEVMVASKDLAVPVLFFQ